MLKQPPMRSAIVKDGKIIDILVPGPGFQPPAGTKLVHTEDANIGDEHDGMVFTKVDAPQSEQDLIDYARTRRDTIVKAGIDFNMAEDLGSDPKIVHIVTDNIVREEIQALAHVAENTGKNVTLVTRDLELTLSPTLIIRLKEAVINHIAHSHDLTGQIIKHIRTKHIASRAHIDFPETATAVKLAKWHLPHG